jgi:hypothetical protein
LEGKKVVALGHKAQRHPHSSWWASDNSRFIVLTSLIKKWRAKNFDVTCDFQFRPIVPKMLTSCPCNDGSSKNVITRVANQIAALMLRTTSHARLRMTINTVCSLQRHFAILNSLHTHSTSESSA